MKKVWKITGIVLGAPLVLSVVAAITAPPEEEASAPAPEPERDYGVEA